MSGYEVADKVFSGVERTIDVGATIVAKIYALVLIVGGVASFFIVPQVWWAAIVAIAYGVYLMLPGEKMVVY